MANTLQIGVIGRHFGANVHAAAFRLNSGCDVVAVGSHEWRMIVENPRIDAVSIAVPPQTQVEIARHALEKKKHVFLEKPISGNYTAAESLLELSKQSKSIAMVDFELPFLNSWMMAKKIIDSGDIGRIENVEVNWTTVSYSKGEYTSSWKFDSSSGGGLLCNFGSHVFNYIEHFFGRIVSINCRRTFVTHSSDMQLDVALELNLKTQPGTNISVLMDGRGRKPLHRIEIIGNRGVLLLENTASDYVSGFVLKKDGKELANEKPSLEYPDGRIWAVGQVVDSFIKSILDGTLRSPSLHDGCRSEELIEFANKSDRQHKELVA